MHEAAKQCMDTVPGLGSHPAVPAATMRATCSTPGQVHHSRAIQAEPAAHRPNASWAPTDDAASTAYMCNSTQKGGTIEFHAGCPVIAVSGCSEPGSYCAVATSLQAYSIPQSLARP